jgi:adenylylsulfate kinase-like enzyme
MPERPEVHIDTTATTPERAAEQVIAALEARGILSAAGSDS